MIAWIGLRNLRARAFHTLLTVAVVAAATATALVVPMTLRQVDRGATEAVQVFDLLVTAKGSATQAVLSSLFYLDAPIGNVPYAVYTELANDPRTRRAVPIGLGDSFRGHPIVGTADGWTPPDDVVALESAGATVLRYEGADHGFVHDPSRPAHRPDDAADAWARVLAFLAG